GIRRGLKAGRGARDPGFPSPENRSPADPPDAAGRRDGGDSLADRSLPDQRGHPADPIQLRLGFPFNLALCTVLQTIPMALPTARGRQGPQELSAYRRTTRGKGSLVIFFAQANPPPRSTGSALPPNSRSPVETHGFRRTRQGSPCPLQPEEIEISHHVPSTGAAIPLAPSVEQDERADGLFAAAEGQS